MIIGLTSIHTRALIPEHLQCTMDYWSTCLRPPIRDVNRPQMSAQIYNQSGPKKPTRKARRVR